MKHFNSERWSKSELLELMIAQKKEIEKLENDLLLLREEVEIRDRKINEMDNLVQVTKTLVKLTERIDERLSNCGEKEHG